MKPPNYIDWLKLDKWLLKDAIVLLLDIDPACEAARGAWLVIESREGNALGCFADTHKLKHLIQKVFEYYRLAQASYRASELRVDGMEINKPSVEPDHWLCWARSNDLLLPAPLQDFLGEIDQRSELFKVPAAFDVPTGGCKRDSLLKMVLGMAMAHYDYKPGSARNTATGRNRGSIFADLERIGLTMDNDTVRKVLDEAKARFKDITSI